MTRRFLTRGRRVESSTKHPTENAACDLITELLFKVEFEFVSVNRLTEREALVDTKYLLVVSILTVR